MISNRKKSSSIGILILVLVVSSLTVFGDAAEPRLISLGAELEVERLVEEGDFPSFHICIISGNEINWARGFGEQTDLNTTFLIGSIQKVFTAISILQLYEDGKIELDDKVNDYIPFTLQHPNYPNANITIRMLLSHRSGLTATLHTEFCYDWEGGYTPEYQAYVRAYSASVIGIPIGEYLAKCLPLDGVLYRSSNWAFEPGTEYGYSNTGYKILNYLIELVSNQTVSEYMKENIFQPLRMNNTGFNSSEFIDNHAIPHTRMYGDPTNKDLPIWDGKYMIRSSVKDMGNLLITLMNDGHFDGFQLLQKDTLAMMFQNTIADNILKNLRKAFARLGYGLGIEVANHGLFGHGGSTVGFTAEMWFNPSTKVGFVRFSNVNAILDAASTYWQNITADTVEIRTLVMTDIGMLPAFDTIILILLVISSISCGAFIFSLWRMRRKSTLPL